MVEIIAAKRGVAGGREHFEYAPRQLEQRQVEGAAAEVVHREGALGRIVEAVGDRRRSRLVEQAQHVQAGELRRVLGRLSLGVVEIGRNGDDRAGERAAEARLGA